MLGILSGPGALLFARFLGIYRRFIGQGIRVVEFVDCLFCLLPVRLRHAMGIVVLRTCVLVCVHFGDNMWVL